LKFELYSFLFNLIKMVAERFVNLRKFIEI